MEDFSQTLCLYFHFGAVSLIHSAPQRNAATLRKVLAPFAVSHVIAIDSCSLLPRSFSLSFFLFLDFIAISDCVFNNKNIIPLGLAGYEIIITILALLSYPARPRCTQICVYPRAFMTLRVAQFSLKIAHLSFSMGPRGPRAYGLLPRLWLLVHLYRVKNYMQV